MPELVRPHTLSFPWHGLNYIKTPKNACSTVIRTLGGDKVGENVHARTDAIIYDPERDAGNPVLLIHRDPYTRLVSAYLEKITRPSPREPFACDVVRTVIKEERGEDWEPVEDGTTPTISFHAFVRYVVSRPDSELDQHWRSQISFVDLATRDFEEDVVPLAFESLATDWNASELTAATPLETHAPHATTSTIKLDRRLHAIDGEKLFWFRQIAGTWPPKSCFRQPALVHHVQRRFAKDYELVEFLKGRTGERIPVSELRGTLGLDTPTPPNIFRLPVPAAQQEPRQQRQAAVNGDARTG